MRNLLCCIHIPQRRLVFIWGCGRFDGYHSDGSEFVDVIWNRNLRTQKERRLRVRSEPSGDVCVFIRVFVWFAIFQIPCSDLCGTDFCCSDRLRLIKSTHLLYYVRNAYHINLALWFKCIFARRSWILCRFHITVRLTSNLWFQVI